jgi:hypothetical protein
MKTSLATLLLASLAAGFDVVQYPNKRCTGMSVAARGVNAEKGCVVAREDGYTAGMINDWTGDGDNNIILALYTGTKCCHANLIKTVDWEDSCIEIESGARVGSFQAVDPNDPDGAGGGYDTCEDEYEDNEVKKVESSRGRYHGSPPSLYDSGDSRDERPPDFYNSSAGAALGFIGIFAPRIINVHGTMGIWSAIRGPRWVK